MSNDDPIADTADNDVPSKPVKHVKDEDDYGLYEFKWNDHMKAIIALCLCIASMSYMMMSVFPYSGFMAIRLVDGVTKESAGTYAGLLASAFMIGSSCTSYAFGKLADLYGRKFTLMASLAMSGIFTFLFGVAQSFTFALIARFLSGLCNSIMSLAKTSTAEQSKGSEQLEKRDMGLVVGMWGWGFLWGPALGGFLAEPAVQYPDSRFVQTYEPFLEKFPFLLPNLVGVILCIVAMVAVEVWLPETLPEARRRSPRKIPKDICKLIRNLKRKLSGWYRERGTEQEKLPLAPIMEYDVEKTEEEQIQFAAAQMAAMNTFSIPEEESIRRFSEMSPDNIQELRFMHNESGTMLCTQVQPIAPRPSSIHVRPSVMRRMSRMSLLSPQKQPSRRRSSIFPTGPNMATIWNRIETRVHLILYWIFAFIQVCSDEAFPLYCISKEGGLGLTANSIGQILSISGLVFGICQYFVYASIVNRRGLYWSLRISSVCLPIMLLIPFSVFIPNKSEGVPSWAGTIYLCIILASSRILSSVFYSSIFIALNRTVPDSDRATMNGLQILGGSKSKSLGPVFAGVLVAFFASSGVMNPRLGGFFIWFVIGGMGALYSLAITFCLNDDQEDRADENGEDLFEPE